MQSARLYPGRSPHGENAADLIGIGSASPADLPEEGFKLLLLNESLRRKFVRSRLPTS
jgi:hypothetical protein